MVEAPAAAERSPDSRYSKSTGKYDGGAYGSNRGVKIGKICRRCYRPQKEDGVCATCNAEEHRTVVKKSGKRYENVFSPHERKV